MASSAPPQHVKVPTAKKSTSKKCISLVALLFLPGVVIPVCGRLLISRAPQTFDRIALYLDTLAIPLLAVFALSVWLRLRKFMRTPSTLKWNIVNCALLYAEAVYLLLLLATVGDPIIRVPILTITIVFIAMFWLRPSFTLILLYATVYFALFLDSAIYFSSCVHFGDVEVTRETFIVYMALPTFWLANVLAAILLDLRNQIDRPSRLHSLRYAVGLSIVLVIFVFAHFYENVALLTNGDAFDYTEKAISLQWKRKLAAAFPGLPLRVYANLVTEHRGAKQDLQFYEFTDHPAGLKTYMAGIDTGIGSAWADFYVSMLKHGNVSQYRIVKSGTPTASVHDDIYQLLLYTGKSPASGKQEGGWHMWPGIEAYPRRHPNPSSQYVIYLPKSMRYNAGLPSLTDETDRNLSLTMRPTGKSDLFVPEIYEGYLLDVDSLGMYLRYSRNYLDDSAKKTEDAFSNDFLDSFLDYVYFSVTTISTTGYGDITAIDPQVRLMTVAEIASGWFLLLLFGALVVSGINKD